MSVCIPAFNEAEVIADTLEEAAAVLDGMEGEHEILVVDDGSSDSTWEIIQSEVERHPNIRPIRHPRNLGNAVAQRTLVEAAAGDVIFHIGADQEWQMAEIPRMLELIEQGNDIVIGVRRIKQYTRYRKFVSAAYNALVAMLWGRHFGDLGSIKMARAALWKQIPFGTTSAFIHAERILIAHRNGARIATMPVDHMARRTGASKFSNPMHALFALWDLLRFRLSARSRLRLPEGWRRTDQGDS